MTPIRFFGGSPDTKEAKWIVDVVAYKTFDNYRIPNKFKVNWQLQEADFNWLQLEVTDITCNTKSIYR